MEKQGIFTKKPHKLLILVFLLILTVFPTGSQKPADSRQKLRLTHFLSFPLINEEFKKAVSDLQNEILATLDEPEREKLVLNSPDIMHITLSVLNLENADKKQKALELFEKQQEQAKKFLENTKVKISLGGLDFFGYHEPKPSSKIEKPVEKPLESKPKEEEKVEEVKKPQQRKKTTGVIFLDVEEDEHMHKLRDLANIWLKEYVDQGIILKENLKEMNLHHNVEKNLYHAEKYHVTLFRFMEGTDLSKVIEKYKNLKFGETHGQSLDLSVMGTFDETKFYKAEKKHVF